MLSKLYEFIDPVVSRFGLSKTEFYVFLLMGLAIASGRDLIDPQWLEWARDHVLEALVVAGGPAVLFLRDGIRKAEQKQQLVMDQADTPVVQPTRR